MIGNINIFEILFFIFVAVSLVFVILFFVFKNKEQKYKELFEKNSKKVDEQEVTIDAQEKLIIKYEKNYSSITTSNTDLIKEIDDLKEELRTTKEQLSKEKAERRNIEAKNSIDQEDLKRQISKLEASNQTKDDKIKKLEGDIKKTKEKEVTRDELLNIAKKNNVQGLSKKSKEEIIKILKEKGLR